MSYRIFNSSLHIFLFLIDMWTYFHSKSKLNTYYYKYISFIEMDFVDEMKKDYRNYLILLITKLQRLYGCIKDCSTAKLEDDIFSRNLHIYPDTTTRKLLFQDGPFPDDILLIRYLNNEIYITYIIEQNVDIDLHYREVATRMFNNVLWSVVKDKRKYWKFPKQSSNPVLML